MWVLQNKHNNDVLAGFESKESADAALAFITQVCRDNGTVVFMYAGTPQDLAHLVVWWIPEYMDVLVEPLRYIPRRDITAAY